MIRLAAAGVLAVALCFAGAARGQAPMQQEPLDLKSAPPKATVVRAAHCDGYFRVDLKDGSRFDYPEINLRFKIDTSPKGPAPGTIVKLRQGMVGDRAVLVFASVADLKKLLSEGCTG